MDALEGFIIFTIGLIIPLMLAVRYSVTSWDGMSQVKEFVGFRNYIVVLKRRSCIGQRSLYPV